MKTRMILGTILALLLLAGCASQNLKMTVLRPAEVNLGEYHQIAIGDIWGHPYQYVQAQDIREAFTARLVQSEYFEFVLDRQYLERILQEHYLGWAGYLDADTAPQLGKIIGAGAFVFGRITRDEYKEEITTQKETQKDKAGEEYEVIKYTRTGTHHLGVTFQVIDIESTKIIAMKELRTQFSSSRTSEDSRPPSIDKNFVYDMCVQDLSHQFIRTLAPYYETVSTPFETDKKNLPELLNAYRMASVGEYQSAIRILQGATRKTGVPAASMAKAHYDLGLLQMYVGDFNAALDSFVRASNLVPKNSRYKNAIVKCRDERFLADQVRRQMEGPY